MTKTALDGRRVLLVEDEILVAMLVEAALTDENCVIVGPIGDLAEAMAAARAFSRFMAYKPVSSINQFVADEVLERKDLGEAVRSVSLSIHQGEVLALIGPSGCGKTTLLRTLNRLTELTPSAARSGEILLDGEDIHALVDTSLRSRVAMVFQQPNPFPMSIFDNVAFALREQGRKRPGRRELEPLVVDALRRAGLYDEVRDDLDRPALRLSGGQQQRLCIARAIAPRPEVLLMDEPCSALDPISTGVIEELIGELRRDLAVVIVTHNLAQAQRVADKVAFMYLGDLVEYGPADDVFEDPRAERTREYVRGAFG